MKYFGLFLISLACAFSSSFAQEGNHIWYFGDQAGLDFRNSPPTPLLDGALATNEGCATISDADGNLLFYTDGINVWNQAHNLMPNGSGLLGDPSATQSSIVVPDPGDTNRYYIFTVPASELDIENGKLHYSVVDMRLESGQGDVSNKNVALVGPVVEKVTSVLHTNGQWVWVITHEWGTNAFYAYLVKDTGIDPPVISNVGDVHSGITSNAFGYLKASLSGTRLALCRLVATNPFSSPGVFEIFTFNPSTGVVSNPIQSAPDFDRAYGLEFSPDGSKLYVAKNGPTTGGAPHELYQIDLWAGSATDILNSETLVGTSPNPDPTSRLGALQLGRDGRIYVARGFNEYLGVIENPNASGAACNYVNDGIFLGGRESRYGLPNFISAPEAVGPPLRTQALHFRAEWQSEGEQVRLSWENLASAPQTFQVERSEDGKDFQVIARVENSPAPPSYTLLDEQVPPSGAFIYYRLRALPSGQILAFTALENTEISLDSQIYPNPVARGENLKLILPRDANPFSAKIVDMKGQTLLASIPCAEGEITISTASLPAGTYFLVIQGSAGRITRRLFLVY